MNLGDRDEEEEADQKPARKNPLEVAEMTIRILSTDLKEQEAVNASLIKTLRDKQNLIDELKMGTLPVGKVVEMIDEFHALVRLGGDQTFRVAIEASVLGQVDVGTRVVLAMNRGAILYVLAPEKDLED